MKKQKPTPAFQLYYQRFLIGTADMSAAQVGAYIRLLCHQWDRGGLPNDNDRLMALSGLYDGNAVAFVKEKFKMCEDGLLRNEFLVDVKKEQDEYRKKQSENAKTRWNSKNEASDGNANGMPPHNQRISQDVSQADALSTVPSTNGTLDNSKELSKERTEKKENRLADEKKQYELLAEKNVASISEFIKRVRPKYQQPYRDLWDLFAEKYNLPRIRVWGHGRERKLTTRLNEEAFDFVSILKEVKTQPFAMESKWFTIDWIMENDTNYVKILERKYESPAAQANNDDSKSISSPNIGMQ